MPNAVEAAPTMATSPAIGIRHLPEVLHRAAPEMQPPRHEPDAAADLDRPRGCDLAVEACAAVELDHGEPGGARDRICVVARRRDDGARAGEPLGRKP